MKMSAERDVMKMSAERDVMKVSGMLWKYNIPQK
jgi:hypothetical protein